MAPLKKRRSTPKLPLALNPQKSKDVLAVLAERNQPVVPVGVWVEPASPHTSEDTAYTAAHIIEEELKERLRKKQEALKLFQRQAKHRVNQRIRLRKKQQLEKSCEEEEEEEKEEEEDTVAMLPSDLGHLTSKRTRVFPNNLNAARSYPSQKLDDGIKDRENQNQLLQQALALKESMKKARHQLASFKIMSQKYAAVFPQDTKESFSTHQEPDPGESSSKMIDKKGKGKMLLQNQQGFFSKEKNKEFSRVQKAHFKNPLYAVKEEEQLNKLHLQETQDSLSEAEDDPLETQGDLTGVQSTELEAQNIKPHCQDVELARQSVEDQVVESKAQTIEPKVHVFKIEPQDLMLEAQNIELEDRNTLEVQDCLSPNEAFLPKDQNILPNDQNILRKCQDQHFLLKDQHVFPKDQNIQPTYQDQDFIPKCPDQHFILKDQHIVAKDQNSLFKFQHQHFPPREHCVLPKDQCVFSKEQNTLRKHQDQDFLPRHQKVRFKETYSIITEKGRDGFSLAGYQSPTPKVQDQTCIRDQKVHFKEPYPVITEKGRDGFSLVRYQSPTPKVQDQAIIKYQKVRFKEPYLVITEKGRDGFSLAGYQSPIPKVQEIIKDQNMFFEQPSSCLREVRVRDEFPLEYYHYVNSEVQHQASPGHQGLYSRQQPSVRTAERWRDMRLDGHQCLPAKHRREASSRRQVSDKYQSGWNTEFQTPLGLQFEVNQEEDKKERQKRYLRYRRLFMDIEREKVKEQQRQKECRKRIEKIKRKKEQQRYAEEQRLLRMNFHEEPYSGEKMSEMLAQLRLEEMKEAREKQQRRERECQRYLEALRAQIQEKMQLYNITLPPLCGCGPDFWDAHPNTCANNCIFYKNHRAYTRALFSVINSCDTPSWTLTLRAAIHNFASAYRRTLKNVYTESEIN